MHAIARIAIFRDERLVVNHPELAVQSRKNKTAWRENGKLVWTDSRNPKVQDYNIAICQTRSATRRRRNPIRLRKIPRRRRPKRRQFVFQKDQPAASTPDKKDDVILTTSASRTEGLLPRGRNSTAVHRIAKSAHPAAHASAKRPADRPTGPQRTDVITAFLKKAYAELHPTGVLLSLDVFGVMAWQRQVDLAHTGQDIVGMAHYCDVLSPMIYPSHFFGMDNIAHPGDASPTTSSANPCPLRTHHPSRQPTGVVIRPWLQAFHWRTKTYSPEYIKIQVATAKEKGGIGFLFWNAANDYSKPYEAMPEMKAANAKEPKQPQILPRRRTASSHNTSRIGPDQIT